MSLDAAALFINYLLFFVKTRLQRFNTSDIVPYDVILCNVTGNTGPSHQADGSNHWRDHHTEEVWNKSWKRKLRPNEA